MTDIKKMLRYHAWAHQRTAYMIASLPAESRPAPLRFLSHLARAERVWLGRIGALPVMRLELWETDSLEVCQERLAENQAALRRLSEDLDESRLNTPIAYQTMRGDPFEDTLGDILTHLVNHATHHRAQISLLVRQAGQVPLLLDYIVYIRETAS